MAEKLYGLTETDLQILKEIKEEHLRKKSGQPPRHYPEDEHNYLTPEVYAARTPPGGIPALEEFTGTSPDEPGSAVCQIFNLRFSPGVTTGTSDDSYRLFRVPSLTKRVFNLTHRNIAGDAWIIAWRTKYGTWVTQSDADEAIVDTGTGTGTDQDPDDFPGGGACTELLRAGPNDCLIADGPDGQTLYLENTGVGTWTSTTEMHYPDSTSETSGVLVAQFNTSTGLLDLFLNGTRLFNCGNGCYSGGWMTGHVQVGSGTTECDEEVFTVCLTCGCCPIDGWDGEGWYCVVDEFGTDIGTGTTNCSPVFLTEADRCDPDVIICSGPYATEAEAAAVCSDEITAPGSEIQGSGQFDLTQSGLVCDITTQNGVISDSPGPGVATIASLATGVCDAGDDSGGFFFLYCEDDIIYLRGGRSDPGGGLPPGEVLFLPTSYVPGALAVLEFQVQSGYFWNQGNPDPLGLVTITATQTS